MPQASGHRLTQGEICCLQRRTALLNGLVRHIKRLRDANLTLQTFSAPRHYVMMHGVATARMLHAYVPWWNNHKFKDEEGSVEMISKVFPDTLVVANIRAEGLAVRSTCAVCGV